MNAMAYLQLFVRLLIILSITTVYLRHVKTRQPYVRAQRTETLCGLFLLFFLLLGCTPSLHPLYTEDTLTFDEKLIGKWYGEDLLWTFTQSGEKEYTLRILDKDMKEALLQVHLVELGTNRYLDLFTAEEWEKQPFPGVWMPVHAFMKIEQSDPNLHVQWVVLGKLIEDDPNMLKHENIPETNGKYSDVEYLITAPTEDIQRVMMQYTEDILEGNGVLKRCPSLFSKKDIIFEDNLLGQWLSKDEDCFISLILSENNGYKIKYREKGKEELSFDGVLYRYHGRCILGLYTKTSSSNEVKGLDLIPDLLLAIDIGDNELKAWHLSWEDLEDFKVKDAIYDFDALAEPDTVFKKQSMPLTPI